VVTQGFIGEQKIGVLYGFFEQLSIRPNLTQNGAINVIFVFDNREDKIKPLAAKASEIFDVQITPGLSLLTIRHYTVDSIKRFTEGKNTLKTQQTKQNATWPF
jgi:aspartate kinase